MKNKTIFDIVMPDLQERRTKLESIIASHSNPTFAAKVCGDLSPLFYFYAQKSWELLDETLLMIEVEDWFKAAKEQNLDLITMASWLLLLLEHQYMEENHKLKHQILSISSSVRKKQHIMEENHKLIHRMIARHLASTEKHKPKLCKRLLKVIDNAGNKVGALELVHDNSKSMAETNYGYKETYVNDETTWMDEDEIKRKSDINTESVFYEEGVPRTDYSQVKFYVQEGKRLLEKDKTEGLNENERKLLNMYTHGVYKGRIRYDKPQTDRAAANLRRGFRYFCQKLDEATETPKFGSDFLKEGFKSGRACIWKSRGIYKDKHYPWGLNNPPDFIKSNSRYWLLEPELLRSLDEADMRMLHTCYQAGMDRRLHPREAVPLQKTYEFVSDLFYRYTYADCEALCFEIGIQDASMCKEICYENLGLNHSFLTDLQAGLGYYGVIS